MSVIFSKPDSALVIVGHGSTVNPDSSGPTWRHAAWLAGGGFCAGAFGEVHCAFWKEEPSLRQVLHCVDRREVYVVPNFISEGYFTQTVIPREMGLTGPITEVGGHLVKYCEPVGNHERMTELLLGRAAEIAPGVPPEKTSLFIVGHGTGLNDNSAVAAKREVERIRALGLYAQVESAYMEEEPLIARWDEYATQPNVVVVPFFIADGLHSYEDIPVLLGIASESPGAASAEGESIFARNPYRLRGRTLYYASSIGTKPGFGQLILDQVTAFDAKHRPEETSHGLPRDTTRAFFDWLVAGGERIGQITITAQLDVWVLRHSDDMGMEGLGGGPDSPEDARMLANFDDEGNYRPLKTAPNLPHGWSLWLEGNKELLRALNYFYPAMIGAWLAHQRGELVPVHLRETLARQTGMYRVTQKLSDEQAQAVICRVCRSDGGCLKTILWRVDAGQPVRSLPAGKFIIPKGAGLPLLCHEACNLLVAEARKVVKAEGPGE